MEEHLTEFLAYLRYECGLSANTLLSYRRDLRQLFSSLSARGVTSVATLDPEFLTDHFRRRLDEGLSPRSTARAIWSFVTSGISDRSISWSCIELIRSQSVFETLEEDSLFIFGCLTH